MTYNGDLTGLHRHQSMIGLALKEVTVELFMGQGQVHSILGKAEPADRYKHV